MPGAIATCAGQEQHTRATSGRSMAEDVGGWVRNTVVRKGNGAETTNLKSAEAFASASRRLSARTESHNVSARSDICIATRRSRGGFGHELVDA
eukprot:6191981-Pleurochrysis_carterae.AAC.8